MTLRSYEVTFKNGKSEVVDGKVFLFSESNAVVPVATNLNVYNANLVQSIREVKQQSCTVVECEGLALTKIEKAIALSIVFNAIDNKELDGHVSKDKISDVHTVFEELQEDTESEEEKEAHINIINKLIVSLSTEKNQEQKETIPPYKK
ncbi:hypothetical protein COE01_14880 [Bacillus thuringiensis]|uniref:hypothetical protein n=1 Tax=Bacillus thuringiensis TaxID=1428 RepID=UPI000BF5B382|nr:hypothetical protein [Bacillus thuringiensis]PEW44416.1 hypothetical protein CN444_18195 [Bacillus thuringiensis]PFK07720.1 hypothetical protein COJ17_28125 [Bacillus thuringiensis]PGW83303.1 hypothetical protein COE01_14880 [Bacillus thuringiensis]